MVPSGGLVDGSNVFVDIDGLLKTRPGYSPVGSLFAPIAITSISDSGGTITVVLASNLPPNLSATGTAVTISGVIVNGYDGTYFPITAVSANSFTITGAPNLAAATTGTATLGERINGIISYRDANGDFVDVVATIYRWWLYNNDGTFTDLSGGTLLTGDADDSTRFAPFQQNGLVWVYGVNNANDGLYAWNSTLDASGYVGIVGGQITPISTLIETGTTVTVTSPFNPIGIAIGDSVTITGASVTSYNGTWTVTAVPSATTFQYTGGSSGWSPATGGNTQDTSPSAGAPFTAARDMTVLANRLVVVNTVEGGIRYGSRVRWCSANNGQTWPVLGFIDMQDNFNDSCVGIVRTGATSAIIYRDLSAWLLSAYPGNDANAFTTERVNVTDNMTGPCGPAAIAIAEGCHYYLGQDGRVYTFDGNSIYPISDAIDPVVRGLLNTAISDRVSATYIPGLRAVEFFFPAISDTDPSHAIMYSIRRQAFEPIQSFADAMTAADVVTQTFGVTWLNWVPANSTWPEIPYNSWSAIPYGNSLGVWTGDPFGFVYLFWTANTDNGTSITYNATFPPVRQDPTVMQRISDIELYLKQAAQPEELSFIVWGLLQPYSTPGTPILAMEVLLTNQQTFSLPALPGPNNPQNIGANFIQVELTGTGPLGQMVFAGGTIFIDTDLRGSNYGVQ
jgi:hypothetical protein